MLCSKALSLCELWLRAVFDFEVFQVPLNCLVSCILVKVIYNSVGFLMFKRPFPRVKNKKHLHFFFFYNCILIVSVNKCKSGDSVSRAENILYALVEKATQNARCENCFPPADANTKQQWSVASTAEKLKSAPLGLFNWPRLGNIGGRKRRLSRVRGRPAIPDPNQATSDPRFPPSPPPRVRPRCLSVRPSSRPQSLAGHCEVEPLRAGCGNHNMRTAAEAAIKYLAALFPKKGHEESCGMYVMTVKGFLCFPPHPPPSPLLPFLALSSWGLVTGGDRCACVYIYVLYI